MSNGTTFRLDPTYYLGMDLQSNSIVVCVLQNAITDTQSLIQKIVK